MKRLLLETQKMLQKTYFIDRKKNMLAVNLKRSEQTEETTKKLIYNIEVQKKLNYLLPTTCASQYMKISGSTEIIPKDAKQMPETVYSDKVRINRCNKRTCSFCSRELVRENRDKIKSVLKQAVRDERSIQMITKTIPNVYIDSDS